MLKKIPIRIELSKKHYESEKQYMRNDDFIIEKVEPLKPSSETGLAEGRFLDDIVITLVTSTIGTLAEYFISYLLKKRKSGLEIDLQTSPPTVSTIKNNIPPLHILVIDRNGKGRPPYHVNTENPQEIVSLLREIFSIPQ